MELNFKVLNNMNDFTLKMNKLGYTFKQLGTHWFRFKSFLLKNSILKDGYTKIIVKMNITNGLIKTTIVYKDNTKYDMTKTKEGTNTNYSGGMGKLLRYYDELGDDIIYKNIGNYSKIILFLNHNNELEEMNLTRIVDLMKGSSEISALESTLYDLINTNPSLIKYAPSFISEVLCNILMYNFKKEKLINVIINNDEMEMFYDAD